MLNGVKLICLALITALTFALIPITVATAEETTYKFNGNTYIKTFEDDFNSNYLDDTKWKLCPEWSRQGGYCYWDNNMTSLDGEGNLKLDAQYVDGTLRCGAIRSRDLFYQKYGYFEISAKLQTKGGFWSAFWLMPDSIDKGVTGGSDGTEIDIFEAFSVKGKRINHAIHYDGYGSNHKSIGTSVEADVYDGQYHNFALEWTPTAYTFFIDGKQTYQITSEQADICNVQTYLKITLESGSWTGLPNAEEMPDSLYVDYVKVYQSVEPVVVCGDVNGNGNITMIDVYALRKYLANIETNINIKNSDIKKDNKIDLKDIYYLRAKLSNLIESIPVVDG